MRQSSTLCYSLLKLPSCTEAEAASCSRDTVETKEKPLEQDDDKLSLITWNVDGLDGVQQAWRARALCCYLTQ